MDGSTTTIGFFVDLSCCPRTTRVGAGGEGTLREVRHRGDAVWLDAARGTRFHRALPRGPRARCPIAVQGSWTAIRSLQRKASASRVPAVDTGTPASPAQIWRPTLTECIDHPVLDYLRVPLLGYFWTLEMTSGRGRRCPWAGMAWASADRSHPGPCVSGQTGTWTRSASQMIGPGLAGRCPGSAPGATSTAQPASPAPRGQQQTATKKPVTPGVTGPAADGWAARGTRRFRPGSACPGSESRSRGWRAGRPRPRAAPGRRP